MTNGKGSRRRAGADDEAFKRAPWPPPSPLFRKAEAEDTRAQRLALAEQIKRDLQARLAKRNAQELDTDAPTP